MKYPPSLNSRPAANLSVAPGRTASRLMIGCFLAVMASGMASAGVYKWVDENGKVHYGDAPPEQAQGKKKSVKINTPAPTPAEREAALKRAEEDRRKLDHLTQTRKSAEAKAKQEKPATAAVGSAAPANETPCQKEWREFREKAACFAPFRTATGGIRPEAYEKCKEAVQPGSACPP